MMIPKGIDLTSREGKLRATIGEALDNVESISRTIKDILKKKNRAVNKLQQRLLEDKLERTITALSKALEEV